VGTAFAQERAVNESERPQLRHIAGLVFDFGELSGCAFNRTLVLELGELWYCDSAIDPTSGTAASEVLPEECLRYWIAHRKNWWDVE
jgi:hypothetical protein